MTYAEFEQAAWDAMPPIRKRVAGRHTFNELLRVATYNWCPDYVSACRTDEQRQVYARQLLEQVRHGHQTMTGATQQEYGFIWVFLLSAVASALIQWLVQRWLDNHFNRADLEAWSRETQP